MPININCVSYVREGGCSHQAAPRRWFGCATCIEWESQMGGTFDPRLGRPICKLRTAYAEPPHPPAPPPVSP